MFDAWTVFSVVVIAACFAVALSPLANREARRDRELRRNWQARVQDRKLDNRLHPRKGRRHEGEWTTGDGDSKHFHSDSAPDGNGDSGADGGGAD